MAIRVNKVIKEFNVGLDSIVEFLAKKGIEIEASPNAKIEDDAYALLAKAFGADKNLKEEANELFRKERPAKVDHAEEKAKAEAEAQAKAEAEAKAKAEAEAKAKAEAEAAEKAKAEAEAKAKAEAEAKAQAEAEKAQAEAEAAEKAKAEAAAKAAEEAEPKAEETPAAEQKPEVFKFSTQKDLTGPKVLGTIDLNAINTSTRPKKKTKEEKKKERDERAAQNGERKKRERIKQGKVDIDAAAKQIKNDGRQKQNGGQNQGNGNRKKDKGRKVQPQITEEDVAKQVKETLARLTSKNSMAKGAKYRKDKREAAREAREEEMAQAEAQSTVLKLTEFVTANELATMMNIPVTKVISTCFSVGIMVSINQRLDAETIELVASEFGFTTEFVSADVQEAIAEEEDCEEDLVTRAPIVTVMGHVDHGKTSLLDGIRNANVIAGEAGGITQHIGAYNVTLSKSGRHITFLDTPGHEAFTAMRARGAQVTDIAIVIIAADDDIMPQTKEAISHAAAANVPIVFAINKIDKPGANPDKIKEGLAQMNYLVEEWGGKYQSQDISAKKGTGVYELLEKVLLEADMLDLKANPNRKAVGTIIESSLDKGRGYVSTVLVSNGTLRQGDIVIAGTSYGRVKAMFNERGQRVKEVGPSEAATILGLNGAPQAGDQLNSMDTDQEAREIASRREQLAREQSLRTQKTLTLEEIGRRLKLGDYQELNIVVKGDVDGSVEALSDSFIKLSTENIVVNVVSKGVGQISENDVTLAAASKAVIVGFQVRPSAQARRLADTQGVEIRQYSIIYDAIEEVKEAMEGMLKPTIREEVTANVEVRQVYNISKVGQVAGAYVLDGKVSRSNKARLIRDGIVIFTGNIAALKRFKDDVKEVTTNFECGISLAGCNDIKEGDMIETFEEIEVKQKL